MDAVTSLPPPVNEPIRMYAPGSPERASLEARLKELAGDRIDLTMTIDGEQRAGGGEPIDIAVLLRAAELLAGPWRDSGSPTALARPARPRPGEHPTPPGDGGQAGRAAPGLAPRPDFRSW